VEVVADGFNFTEGPTWRAADQKLLFTDIPANTIYELTPPSTIYFTDPPYGISSGQQLLEFNGVFRVAPTATSQPSGKAQRAPAPTDSCFPGRAHLVRGRYDR
jgi:hypothetical protein